MGEVLFVLLIALTVVTLVGHGIWSLAAVLFRAVMGLDEHEPSEKRGNAPTVGG